MASYNGLSPLEALKTKKKVFKMVQITKIQFKSTDVDKNEPKTVEFSLNVSKGNKKPIPEFVWLISMQSSSNCFCRLNGLCPIADDCYGLDYELNPLFRDNTLSAREKDESAVDFLVKNPNGAEFLANELIKRSNRARSDATRLKFLRWNVTGDLKGLEHLQFVESVAIRLFKAIGTITVLYSHNKPVVLDFLANHQKNESKQCLRILGSGYMANANFDCFTNDSEALECSSNCTECFKTHGVALCYDMALEGSIIKEEFRESTKKDKTL